jgi:hypothetical protein
MEPSNINLIFAFRGSASVLAHVEPHCVTGITLPPVDATPFFHCLFGCAFSERTRKKLVKLLLFIFAATVDPSRNQRHPSDVLRKFQ